MQDALLLEFQSLVHGLDVLTALEVDSQTRSFCGQLIVLSVPLRLASSEPVKHIAVLDEQALLTIGVRLLVLFDPNLFSVLHLVQLLLALATHSQPRLLDNRWIDISVIADRAQILVLEVGLVVDDDLGVVEQDGHRVELHLCHQLGLQNHLLAAFNWSE